MKLIRITLITLFIGSVIGIFSSCGDDRWAEYKDKVVLDTWIDSIMRQDYIWYKEIPAYDRLNQFVPPAEYLNKLLSANDQNYSFADSVKETPTPSFGFDYALVRKTDNDTAFNALITYIIPESPAAKAGIKRGEWIMNVNNRLISKKTEKELLQGLNRVALTIGEYKKIAPPKGSKLEEDYYDVVIAREGVAMESPIILKDNPIHVYKTFLLTTGEKVAYLMYNSLIGGTADDPECYNNQLRQISKAFAQDNIKSLILDLRRNKGGTLPCAQLLSTLLAPEEYLTRTMAYIEYNDKNSAKNKTLTFDKELIGNGANLNLGTVVVIISGETAGAAELIINALNEKTHRLISIGSTTKGQNVATERFVNKAFNWAINPAVCLVYNSEKKTQSGGFIAKYPISEESDYLRYKPFGDPNEILLNTAIGVLEGTYPPPTPPKTKSDHTKPFYKTFKSPASRSFGVEGLILKSIAN